MDGFLASQAGDLKDFRRLARLREAFSSKRFHCQSRWARERLNMGSEAGVSRCLRKLREGESQETAKLLGELKSDFKS